MQIMKLYLEPDSFFNWVKTLLIKKKKEINSKQPKIENYIL